MKKFFTLLFLLSITTITFAQTTDSDASSVLDKRHEVRLGAVKMLAGPIFESSYEYVIDRNKGFGATLLLNLDKSNKYLEDFSITPYYRMYFQKTQEYGAKGFFVEGFSSFFTGSYDDYNTLIGGETIVKEKDFFDVSLGLALGKKWINSTGFVFEARIGAGRNLLGNSNVDALFKGDLSIGYRF